jgi:hypothetical protein
MLPLSKPAFLYGKHMLNTRAEFTSYEGPGEIKTWGPLSVTTHLGYDNSVFFVLAYYVNQKYKLTFRDFRETNGIENLWNLFFKAPEGKCLVSP